ncbi:MAG: flagellar motor protein MotA [Pseudomonadota bacterium]
MGDIDLARAGEQHKLSNPQLYLAIMVVCLVIVGFVASILNRQIVSAFETNPLLNGLILGVLLVGVLITFVQVISLMPEVRWVNSFRRGDDLSERRAPNMLAPMAELLGRRNKSQPLSTQSLRSILESIGTRLDESRDISRYLIGLLVFLGLLGTFWGLLQTIGSIGDTIRSLDPGTGDTNDILDTLKTGLAEPLDGMGTAFSSSLFGLSGSLILGFLDLWAGRAQNRFYNELENWLSSVTDVESGAVPTIDTASLKTGEDMQRAIEQLAASMQNGGGNGMNQRVTSAMANLAEGIQGLVKQMRSEQQLLRDWVEGQAEQQKDIQALLEELKRDRSEPGE